MRSARGAGAGSEIDVVGDELADARSAQRGDVVAFERIYRRHLPQVHRTARWLLESDDVDDVVQDVFVRVWSKLRTFNGDSALGTWLHRVATNVVLRHRERVGRRGERETHLVDGESGARDSGMASGPRILEGPELRMDLERAISALPDGARAVFVLHEIHGFSHREIAEMLSTEVVTSRTQLHRARRLIRDHLGGAR